MLRIRKIPLLLLALVGTGALGCAPETAPPEAAGDAKEQAAQNIADAPGLSEAEKSKKMEDLNKGATGFGK
ncbi:hypothetical protein [Armatimonas sp.]|uniref:hypothetical protein n=1 Tax=Armatimonas sp. TaxID=1872638 RepID=UPI003750F315